MAKKEATMITLTLQPGGGSMRQGSLLIQRGDLAQLRQFSFGRMSEITDAITAAANDLAELEIDPPDVTKKSKAKSQRQKKTEKTATKPAADSPVEETEAAEEDTQTATTTDDEVTDSTEDEESEDLARLL